MTNNTFERLSFELLYQIFKQCDTFSDLTSLAASCKTLHRVWISRAGELMWPIGMRDIMAFDNALMAVRATDILIDAHERNIGAPSPFPVKTLSGELNKPTLEEMKKVCDFEHLIKCIEHMMQYWDPDEEVNPTNRDVLQLDEKGPFVNTLIYPQWRPRLYRSLYNILLLGAACSKAYNEPFVRAQKEGNTGFLDRCPYYSQEKEVKFDAEDIAYLQQFPLYDNRLHWTDEEFQRIFGTSTEWLLESGETYGILENLAPGEVLAHFQEGDDARQKSLWFNGRNCGAIREIKSMLGAWEHIRQKISQNNSKTRRPENARSVKVVVYGMFTLSEIALPKDLVDTENDFLFATSLQSSPVVDISASLRRVRKVPSGIEPLRRSLEPELQPFLYMLSRYFKLTLKQTRLWEKWDQVDWWRQLSQGDIFLFPLTALGARGGWGQECLIPE